MKAVKIRTKAIAFSLFILAFPVCVVAQDKAKDKQALIQKMIAQQQYVFKAQTALPLSGRLRQLTSGYDLKVSKDTIVSYLPYFGRAYTPPIDPSQGGVQFVSVKFDYGVTERKKGGWEVVIKPTDARNTRQLNLTISQDGYGVLLVTSNDRQPIRFNGYITATR